MSIRARVDEALEDEDGVSVREAVLSNSPIKSLLRGIEKVS